MNGFVGFPPIEEFLDHVLREDLRQTSDTDNIIHIARVDVAEERVSE